MALGLFYAWMGLIGMVVGSFYIVQDPHDLVAWSLALLGTGMLGFGIYEATRPRR